ncbi:MAG: carbon-nitrogen hydrolase family protein [Armatimonadia bacterium]
MSRCLICLFCMLLLTSAFAEVIASVDFEGWTAPLPQTYGDGPQVLMNGVEAAAGRTGAGLRLKLQYGAETPKGLSYYSINFPQPVPIVPQMQEASFWVKTNVPVEIKVPISPFGFIYHGPGVKPSAEWQQVAVRDLYGEMKKWCLRGDKDAGEGFISGLILAVRTTPNVLADIAVDGVTVTAAEGALKMMQEEARKRRFARVNASVVTLPLSEEGRSLPYVLDRLDEAGVVGSDIVLLPMECVQTVGEAIPGPISQAIAAKAKEYGMYVVGNLREQDGEKTYVTSFLCNRQGEIVGKYRKSHKMPDEAMDLGDDLPVFSTDFGKIAMKIGSDRYFADLDHVYTAKGARMILWSQEREPMEDEWLQDYPQEGRAQDYGVFIACARYSNAGTGWITNSMPTYRGMPIGRSYIVNREGMRVACTQRKGSVATAVIPKAELSQPGRGAIDPKYPGFKVLVEPVKVPAPGQWARRKVRLAAIENHVGIEDLLAKIDQCGQMGVDLVCTYEMVWIPIHGDTPAPEQVAKDTAQAAENLRRIAEKAAQHRMYVLVAGVIEKRELNEAILYGRNGREVARYRKCVSTYPEQVCGTRANLLETDFGRIGVRICADNALVELDRCYGVQDADIMFDLTQDWGPDAIHRNLRNISRCMDGQFFRVECTHKTSEPQHRSAIVDPSGVPVAQSEYLGNGIVTAVVDLDNDRPRRYSREWKVREVGGYLPEYQDAQMPTEYNDLRETIIRQRRPELYGALWPEEKKP